MKFGSWEGFFKPTKSIEELKQEKAAEEKEAPANKERETAQKIAAIREAGIDLSAFKPLTSEQIEKWEQAVSAQARSGKGSKHLLQKPPTTPTSPEQPRESL